MGILNKIKGIFKRNAANILPGTWMSYFSSGIANINVTKEKALGNTAIWRALDVICTTFAGLPLEIFERQPNGDNNLAVEHPLYYILHDEPHPLYTSFDFRSALLLNLLNPANGGNSYAVIERGEDSQPLGMRILAPGTVEALYYEANHRMYYKVTHEGVYDSDDIIHIKGLSENGLVGYEKRIIHKDALGNIIATSDHAKNYYKNGAFLSGVVENPIEAPDMGATGISWIQNQFDTKYGGVENAGKVPVLQNGSTFKPMQSNAKDAGLNESRNFNTEEAARIIGVPLHLLYALDKATFNNIEHLTIQFVKFGLSQICKRVEQEFNRKLLRFDERGRMFTRFNLDDLLRGDVESRTKYYDSGLKGGWLNINDCRRMENLNPAEGGNIHLVPLNMIELTKAKDFIPSKMADNQQKRDGDHQTDKNKLAEAA